MVHVLAGDCLNNCLSKQSPPLHPQRNHLKVMIPVMDNKGFALSAGMRKAQGFQEIAQARIARPGCSNQGGKSSLARRFFEDMPETFAQPAVAVARRLREKEPDPGDIR